jgi:hypothetical protein
MARHACWSLTRLSIPEENLSRSIQGPGINPVPFSIHPTSRFTTTSPKETATMNLNIPLPDLTIKEWLRALGTSWAEMRRYSKRRAAAHKLALDLIRSDPAPHLRAHNGVSDDGSPRLP